MTSNIQLKINVFLNLQIVKKGFVICSLLFFNTLLFAQNVGINATGTNPDASAILDIESTTKGLLVPRVALTATNAAAPITLPQHSLMVYNTASAGAGLTAVIPGYYYNAGTGAAPNWVRFNVGNENWKILGNLGTTPTDNFIGTIDAQHLQFRTNNENRMRIMNSTYPTVGIGTAFPVMNLQGNSSVLHVHDGGNSVGSQLILSTHGTADALRVGSLFFAATQAVNERRSASIESYLTAASATNVTGDMRFFTNNNNSYTEKMRIMANGNVGIATTNALQRLHIGSTDATIQTIRVQDMATNGDADFGRTSNQTNSTTNRVVYVDENGDMSARYLYGDNIQSVKLTAGTQNITSTTLVDITGATITFTPRHSTVYLSFAVAGYNPLSVARPLTWFVVSVMVDGVNNGSFLSMTATTDDVTGSAGAATISAGQYPITGLTPGTPVTIKLQGRNGGVNNGGGFTIDRTTYTSYITILD
jgi:hypothetical protein